MKPHKHAEIIKAWADGHEIQVKCEFSNAWLDVPDPLWNDFREYRIKPSEKVVRWLWAYRSPMTDDLRVSAYYTEDEAFQCWHGRTFHKKLEWSREEFDE